MGDGCIIKLRQFYLGQFSTTTIPFSLRFYSVKTFLITFLFFLVRLSCFSQLKESKIDNCSTLLLLASEQWQLDSLGCTGYRGKISDKLKRSKIDSVSKSFLVEKFGKPNNISRFYSGIDKKNYVGYSYFTLNMDCGHKPYMGEYVEFIFDEDEKQIVSIAAGDACR